MKRDIFIGILIIILLQGSACNKILNTTPKDFISPVNYYNTESQLESALAGVYDRLGDTRMYCQGMSCYLVPSDEFYMKGSTTGINANIIDASTLEVNRHWEAIYNGISRANSLLDNINNASASVGKDSINEIKGEALFLRAFYYFLLVDEYGGVPLRLTSIKTPAEPPVPRSTAGQVYAQIVSDMKEALQLVKPISAYSYNTRITKTVVQGILARVYLTMAGSPLNDVSKYQDARDCADSVIVSGYHSLNPDYKQIFINQSADIYDTKEDLWEVEFTGTNVGTIQEGGMIGIYNGNSCANFDTGYANDFVHATAKLYNAYQNGDLRRDWSIAPFNFKASSGSVVTRVPWTSAQIYERSNGKWRREYETLLPRAKTYNGTNWPLLRYSDILLMFAEADNYVNNGPTTGAYLALNQVRRRGYGVDIYVPNAAIDAPPNMSQRDFQTYIQNERLREFAFEGLRKHDLIRWGIYVSVMQAQAQEYQANMPSALKGPAAAEAQRITAKSVLFPIPNSEIATNPDIQQNPGW